MAANGARERGASIKEFMTALGTLEVQVQEAADAAGLPWLTLYRWRRNAIQAPALYHLLATDDVTLPHMGKVRDTLALQTRIAVAMGDDGYETDAVLEDFMDLYRDVTDPVLLEAGTVFPDSEGQPAATMVTRTNMRTLVDEFNGTPYLAAEFVHTVQLNRFTVPR